MHLGNSLTESTTLRSFSMFMGSRSKPQPTKKIGSEKSPQIFVEVQHRHARETPTRMGGRFQGSTKHKLRLAQGVETRRSPTCCPPSERDGWIRSMPVVHKFRHGDFSLQACSTMSLIAPLTRQPLTTARSLSVQDCRIRRLGDIITNNLMIHQKT